MTSSDPGKSRLDAVANSAAGPSPQDKKTYLYYKSNKLQQRERSGNSMPSSSISRDKSPLAVLLDPADSIPLGENDIRLEDYINDKIQTSADFGNLNSLIASVDQQKEQLERQVSNCSPFSIPI